MLYYFGKMEQNMDLSGNHLGVKNVFLSLEILSSQCFSTFLMATSRFIINPKISPIFHLGPFLIIGVFLKFLLPY